MVVGVWICKIAFEEKKMKERLLEQAGKAKSQRTDKVLDCRVYHNEKLHFSPQFVCTSISGTAEDEAG